MRKYLLASLCLMAPAVFGSIPDASGDIQIGNVDTVRVLVPQVSNLSDTYVLNLPDNSSVIIGCRVYSGGSKALAVGHMTAFPVGQVN